MKKIVTVQVILLLGAVVLGGFLKVDLASGPRDLHRFVGMSAGLVGIITLITALKTNQAKTIKILAAVASLCLISAAIGGASLQTTINYDLSYGQMVLSAITALIVSSVLLFKLRTNHS